MASQTVAEICRSSLANIAAATAKITEFQHLASYNWLERAGATISVPGSPPLWSPPSVASKLQPDYGMVYIDQNAARNPRSPLEPLFRALYTENPDFNIAEIDLITDRNNIRKLLRFVQAKSNEPFQIQVEITGGRTALFSRVEKETKEFVQTFKGFGHNFKEAYTKPQSEGTGHHRIVRYNFGGLKCIVRHETDGYIASKTQAKPPTDSLSDALKGLSISKSKPDSVVNPPGAVAVELAGKAVDLSSTLEIKTRAVHRPLDMADVYPQLWISQTPHLVVGYHQHGTFNNVQLTDKTEAVRRWEDTNQEHLCKLAGLLTEIIKIVKRNSGREAIVKYDGGAALKIVVGEGKLKPALPEDLYAKWEEGKTETKQAEEGDDSKVETSEGKCEA